MDMPGGASLRAPNSCGQTDREPTLSNLPLEMRDAIYDHAVTPSQCTCCRLVRLNTSDGTPLDHIPEYSANQTARKFELPNLALVNSQFHKEVMCYVFLKNNVYATVFNLPEDVNAILRQIYAGGQEAAAKIQKLYLIYSKKQHYREIMKTLVPQLAEAGVRTKKDDEVVVVSRIMQSSMVPDYEGPRYSRRVARLPGCQCEFCILQFLHDMR